MAWIHVDVVQPPRIDSLAVTLHPPAYTGWPVQPGERRIVALRGTAVEMTGRSNKPLASATLHPPSGADIPAAVIRRRIEFHDPADAPVKPRSHERRISRRSLIDRSGPYWFDLRDREGLVGRRVRPLGHSSDRRSAAVGVVHAAGRQSAGDARGDRERQSRRERRSGAAHASCWSTRDPIAPIWARSRCSRRCSPVPSHCRWRPRRRLAGATQGDSRTLDFAWHLAPLSLKPGTNSAAHRHRDRLRVAKNHQLAAAHFDHHARGIRRPSGRPRVGDSERIGPAAEASAIVAARNGGAGNAA